MSGSVKPPAPMSSLLAFVVTWITACLLLLWLGDHNTYMKFPNGHIMIKEQATFPERLVFSALFAAVFSLVNTVLLRTLERFRERRRTRRE
jgi:hypothetical protein